MNNTNESRLTKLPWLACDFPPVLKDFKADQRKLNFGREAVVHAHQSRRSATTAASSVFFVDDDDTSSVAAREMEGNGSPHHSCAENDDVSSLRNAVWAHA